MPAARHHEIRPTGRLPVPDLRAQAYKDSNARHTMTTMAAVMSITLKPPSLLRSNRNSSRAAPTRAIQKQSLSLIHI